MIISWHSFVKNSISSDYSHTHYDFHEKNTGFKGHTVAVINCADAQKQLQHCHRGLTKSRYTYDHLDSSRVHDDVNNSGGGDNRYLH